LWPGEESPVNERSEKAAIPKEKVMGEGMIGDKRLHCGGVPTYKQKRASAGWDGGVGGGKGGPI